MEIELLSSSFLAASLCTRYNASNSPAYPMRSKSLPFKFDPRWLLVPLAGIAGALVILLATGRFGIGLTVDAVGYVRVARELLAGSGIPTYFVLQPPMYPAVLAGAGWVANADPAAAATGVQILLYGLILFLTAWILLTQLPQNLPLTLIGILAVLSARPIFTMTVLALSEALFIVWTLAALLALQLYLRAGSRLALGISIAAAAGATLTRYIGVSLILTGFLVILLNRRESLSRRLVTGALYACLSALPLALWLGRNYLVAGTLTGERGATRFTVEETLGSAWNAVNTWFLPDAWRDWGLVGAVLVGLGLAALYFVLRARTSPRPNIERAPLAPYLAYSFFFIVILFGTSFIAAYDRVNSRLLAPVFVPLLVILLGALDRLLELVRLRANPLLVNWGVALVLALGLVYPFQFQFQRVSALANSGAGGYNTARWHNSPTIAYVRAHRGELPPTLYTNAPDALYFLANLEAQSTPPEFAYNSVERISDVQELRGKWPPAPAALVWFPAIQRDDFLFSLEELQQIALVTAERKFSDGAIYHIAPRPAP